MQQVTIQKVSGPFWRLDNFNEEFNYFVAQNSAGESDKLITQGWEPSISIYGSFGIFPKVQAWTSPDAVNFVLALETAAPVLWGRNDLRFPCYCTKLVIPVVASGITGISVVSVSDSNGEGSGTLAYTVASHTLTWTAPNMTAGAPVDIHLDGDYVIHSGTDTGKTITVRVVAASLPGSNTSHAFTTAVASIGATQYSEKRHR